MNRLTQTLAGLKRAGRKGLFIYITAGAPDFEITFQAVNDAIAAGADVIELGFPFSDPIADGPVIQNAATLALQNGANVAKILDLVRRVRATTDIPLVGMGYVNTLLNYGAAQFVADFKEAGLDGLIIPDLPHEESEDIRALCQRQAMHLIEFVTPQTVPARLNTTCRTAAGFIYCVSVNGVTGVRSVDYAPINKIIDMVREQYDIPLAVGFGIGSPEAAVQAAAKADAVIVGSAVVDKIVNGDLAGAKKLIESMRRALDDSF